MVGKRNQSWVSEAPHNGASPSPFCRVGIGVKGLRPARGGTAMNGATQTVAPPLTPLPTRTGQVSLDIPDVLIDALSEIAEGSAANVP